MLSTMKNNHIHIYNTESNTKNSNTKSNTKNSNTKSNTRDKIIDSRKSRYSKYNTTYANTSHNNNYQLKKERSILREMRQNYKERRTLDNRKRLLTNSLGVYPNGNKESSADLLDDSASEKGRGGEEGEGQGEDISDKGDLEMDTSFEFYNDREEIDRYFNEISEKYQISVEEAEQYYTQIQEEEEELEELELLKELREVKEVRNDSVLKTDEEELLEYQLREFENFQEQEQLDIQYLLESFKIE